MELVIVCCHLFLTLAKLGIFLEIRDRHAERTALNEGQGRKFWKFYVLYNAIHRAV